MMKRKARLHIVREYPKTFEPRVPFNPRNREHMLSYASFLKYNKWGPDGCRFELEENYTNIPAMLADKALEYLMSTYFEHI